MKIQIICTKPGKRRNGHIHPASAFYQEGDWSEGQMKAFEADPDFVVRTVSDDENITTPDDFRLAVDQEVKLQVDAHKEKLQASFDQALKDAVERKTSALKAEYDNALDEAGRKLDASGARITELEKQIAETPKKPASK